MIPVYWLQSLLTLLFPLVLLPFVLWWFWRALRHLDAERLTGQGTEGPSEGPGSVVGVTRPGPPTS